MEGEGERREIVSSGRSPSQRDHITVLEGARGP